MTDRVPGPDHLAPGETVPSSSPKVTLGNAKAVVAAVVGGLASGAAALLTAIGDGAVDLSEFYVILGAVLVGSGLTGGTTWAKSTDVTIH